MVVQVASLDGHTSQGHGPRELADRPSASPGRVIASMVAVSISMVWATVSGVSPVDGPLGGATYPVSRMNHLVDITSSGVSALVRREDAATLEAISDIALAIRAAGAA
jgi:hypothetical protein